jgi:hypothetical protein
MSQKPNFVNKENELTPWSDSTFALNSGPIPRLTGKTRATTGAASNAEI